MPEYFSHPLLKENTIEKRDYQEKILKSCLVANTLCVLPTGTGKTAIAILLAAHRLLEYPRSSVLILAPTRPLAEQHKRAFENALNIVEPIVLITGKIKPEEREKLYKEARVIVATPQTIKNDIENFRLDLSEISLVVVDECHRSVKKYAYPIVLEYYFKKSKYPRTLGLTASPGSDIKRIEEVKKSLHTEIVEIRTEEDIKEYINPINIEWIKVEFDEKLQEAQKFLKSMLHENLNKLEQLGIHAYTKKEIIQIQSKIRNELGKSKNNSILYYVVSLLAETLKIWHAIELFEVQSIGAVKDYISRLEKDKTKGVKRIFTNQNFIKAKEIIFNYEKEHPKILKLKEIVSQIYTENSNFKIIIFSHYRDNISNIYNTIKTINGCNPVILIGQSKKGLNQKQQISIIRDFDAGIYNCLITSPVGEEGLHIPSADIAIMYEPVPSEIRMIQRRGRVGRTKVGKIVFLITKNTRDEANYYVSRRKEKRMKYILKEMQKTENLKKFLIKN
ncbi:MAG: DEAD/DEAH box helicase [Candidatus Aenigmatarchaeota archaeon]|nr:DEAD/DEAH box helicase [Candidatus Aenigmarchaeota archaeon]